MQPLKRPALLLLLLGCGMLGFGSVLCLRSSHASMEQHLFILPGLL
jgi:hypothetical protein